MLRHPPFLTHESTFFIVSDPSPGWALSFFLNAPAPCPPLSVFLFPTIYLPSRRSSLNPLILRTSPFFSAATRGTFQFLMYARDRASQSELPPSPPTQRVMESSGAPLRLPFPIKGQRRFRSESSVPHPLLHYCLQHFLLFL